MSLDTALFCMALAYFCGWALAKRPEDCPREIMGYACRGDYCDHCKHEVEKARDTMAVQRNLWKDKEP